VKRRGSSSRDFPTAGAVCARDNSPACWPHVGLVRPSNPRANMGKPVGVMKAASSRGWESAGLGKLVRGRARVAALLRGAPSTHFCQVSSPKAAGRASVRADGRVGSELCEATRALSRRDVKKMWCQARNFLSRVVSRGPLFTHNAGNVGLHHFAFRSRSYRLFRRQGKEFVVDSVTARRRV